MEHTMIEGWVVVTPTLFQGTQILHKEIREEDGEDVYYPEIYETLEDAWKAIAEDMMVCLDQFLKGERNLEDTDFGPAGEPMLYRQENDEFGVYDEDGNPMIEMTLQEWRDDL